MILDNVYKNIEVILGEAKGTLDCDVNAYWVDISKTAFTPASVDTTSNGVTAVTVVAAPVAGFQRWVKKVVVLNTDTIQHKVTLRLYNSLSNLRRVFEYTALLRPNEKLEYIG